MRLQVGGRALAAVLGVAAMAIVAVVVAVPALAADNPGNRQARVARSTPSTSQLQTKLGSTQSQLKGVHARQQALSGRISTLNDRVSTLAGQVSLVRQRETAAQGRLAAENARVQSVQAAIVREHRRLVRLHRILRLTRHALAAALVSQYEQPHQTFVSLLVDAHGFQQLLDNLQYLSRAKRHERTIVITTQIARQQAEVAAERLEKLKVADVHAAQTAATQTNALAGMNALLSSRQAALAHERSAQSTALTAAKQHGTALEASIETIKQQQAAAEAAARAIKPPPAPPATGSGDGVGSGSETGSPPASSTGGSSGSSSGGAVSGSGGWAIPYPVVLCESGGQNLPPNGAGASGYYQIVPGTWKEYGGGGTAAYLASKAAQDAVAAKIWAGGAGASNWSCAAMVGIH